MTGSRRSIAVAASTCWPPGVHAEARASWLEKLPRGNPLAVRTAATNNSTIPGASGASTVALLQESRKHLISARLREVPGLGPLRVARLIAWIQTPHRFRTRPPFWSYSGWDWWSSTAASIAWIRAGRPPRQPVKIRGLNRNHQPRLKRFSNPPRSPRSVSLVLLRSIRPAGATGRDPALLRLSVARKLAALVLSLWKKGGAIEPKM